MLMKVRLLALLALRSSTLFKGKSIAVQFLLVTGLTILMMASLCVSTRRTVSGVKKLALSVQMDSFAPSRVNMDTLSRTVAPKAATV